MAFKLKMLSLKDARKVLENANLPGILNRDLKFSLYSKAERMETIRESKDKDDRITAAVIEIQRVWRGYHARYRLFEILHPKASAMSGSVGHMSDVSDVRTPTPEPPYTTPRPQNLSKIKTKYKKYCEETIDKPMSFTEFSACFIQQWWRRQLQKTKIITLGYPTAPPPTTNGEASSEIETRDEISRASTAVERQKAATIIQRTWRKHIDIQVYNYYRDLINFKNRGDPALMLRCINPREADLLDSGAGVHIKFRLAGEKFPPNIYYKIFTHRNIADIGAFAPRDYTKADNKSLPCNVVHNKDIKIKPGRAINCYKRWENNGWRLVSDRFVKRKDQDPVVYSSSHKTAKFHHNKMVRKQDVEKKRKQRKIEWMKKMYKQGMLQAKGTQDPQTQNIIKTVAQGMVNAADTRGHEAVEDWEVDELLEWTNGLNFDEYIVDWKEFATSAGSEYLTTQLQYLPDDPFSFNMNNKQACQYYRL